MVPANQYDTASLLSDWNWLVPGTHTPLFIAVLADWVFGSPDGSIWTLSALEGAYTCIASDGAEFNRLNKSGEWLNETFSADWQMLAMGNGLSPSNDECLGWKLHPLLGGKFAISNLQVFSMLVYQSIMGQFHRQLQSNA